MILRYGWHMNTNNLGNQGIRLLFSDIHEFMEFYKKLKIISIKSLHKQMPITILCKIRSVSS